MSPASSRCDIFYATNVMTPIKHVIMTTEVTKRAAKKSSISLAKQLSPNILPFDPRHKSRWAPRAESWSESACESTPYSALSWRTTEI